MEYLGAISKMTEWSLFIFKANHSISEWSKSVPQPVCWRSWSRTVLWRPTRPSRTNTQKRCPFHHRGLECKSRKPRDTWSNWQIRPWSIKWSRAKANRVLRTVRTGHSKHPLPTTQEKTLHMVINTWSILKSECLCSLQPKMENLNIVSKNILVHWFLKCQCSLLLWPVWPLPIWLDSWT